MFTKLKRQLTLTLTLFFIIVIAILVVFINIIYFYQATGEVYDELSLITSTTSEQSLYKSYVPEAFTDETAGQVSGEDFSGHGAFFVRILKNSVKGEYYTETYCINFEDNFGYDQDFVSRLAYKVAKDGTEKGRSGSLFYRAAKYNEGTLVVFGVENEISGRVNALMQTSVCVGCICIILGIWLADIISGYLIKPIKDSFEMQRSFVSDASHELKTPLAIINANAELLETEIQEGNKQLQCIKSEALRMSGLITELLSATRFEKADVVNNFADFCFSDAVNEVVMNFDALAFEKGVIIDSEIAEGKNVRGNEAKLKQLATILVDNAVKYVNENGTIKVLLSKGAFGRVSFSVTNSGSFIKKEDREKVFDRFYRADESRQRDGVRQSFGLGLSIAKSITEDHNGSLQVTGTENPQSTTFRFVM